MSRGGGGTTAVADGRDAVGVMERGVARVGLRQLRLVVG